MVKEAKEAHGMVLGTILMNAFSPSVLFYSSVDYSFSSHEFGNKFSKPLVSLKETYVMMYLLENMLL